MVRNHYLLLGIPPDASQGQIKSVYRTLAKRFHPDRNKGSEAAADLFRQINDAYRVLSDPQLRTAYDRELGQQQSARQGNRSASTPDRESQQKFSKFLGSLLDALFGPGGAPAPDDRRPRQKSKARGKKPVNRPDFNFYYHLAREKKGTPYNCGDDGVYRRASKRKTPLRPESPRRPGPS